MKAIYDLAMGEGQGAVHAHEGRELVFATEEGGRPGFLRCCQPHLGHAGFSERRADSGFQPSA